MKRTPLQRKTPLKSNPKASGPTRKSGIAPKNRSATPKTMSTGPALNLEDARRALMHREAASRVERAPSAPVPPPKRAPRPASDGSFTPATRRIILDRDGGRCGRCGRSVAVVGVNWQHRIGRKMGGTRDPLIASPANGLILCGSGTTGCHGWVEHHPQESARYGWSVPEWANPATVPTLYADGIWRFLGCDGVARPAEDQTITDAMVFAVARNPKGTPA